MSSDAAPGNGRGVGGMAAAAPAAGGGTTTAPQSVPIKVAAAKQIKHNNPLYFFPGIGQATLSYFRFECSDVLKTIDFYQSVGMNLDGTTKLNDGTLVLAFSFALGSMEMNAYSVKLRFELAPTKKLKQAETESATNVRSLSGSRMALPAIGAKSNPALGAAPTTPAAAAPAGDAKRQVAAKLQQAGFAPDTIRAQRYVRGALVQRALDYLVIYTHLFTRTVGKLVSKGFAPKLPQQEYEHVKFAIFEDPNGLEVWLVEAPDELLGEQSTRARQWFGRIGYLALTVPNAMALCRYYTSLLSTAVSRGPSSVITKDGLVRTAPRPAANASFRLLSLSSVGRGGGAGGGGENARGGSSTANESRGDPALSDERVGFTVVDSETLVTGLRQVSLRWLANAERDLASALCLVEMAESDGSAPSRSAGAPETPEAVAASAENEIRLQARGRETSPFLGVGFELPILETATKLLAHFSARSLPEPPRYLAFNIVNKDSGFLARLDHPSWLAPCFPSVNPSLPTGGADAEDADSAAEPAGPPRVTVRGWTLDLVGRQRYEPKSRLRGNDADAGLQGDALPLQYCINQQHLKGHARALSAGAVQIVALEWWARVQLPNPQSLGATDDKAAVRGPVRRPNRFERQLLLSSRRHSR